MTPRLLFLLLLCCPFAGRAQLAPFPAPGMEYGSVYWCNPFDCPTYFNTSMRYVGDTLLCGSVWNRFVGLPNLNQNYPTYLRAEQGKYYGLVNCATQELWYDFSKKTGDTVVTADLGAMKVIAVGTFTLTNGAVRKKMTMRKIGTTGPLYTWVDGIGDIERSFFRSSDWEGGREQLSCVRDLSGLVHQNPLSSLDCDSLLCPQPQPKFEFACTGQTFQFANLSREADDYSWDFGDGQTSTEKDPVHIFATPGCYRVTLKAESDCLPGQYSASRNVTVNAPVFWEKAAHQPPAVFQKMQFLDEQRGWAISSKTIWKTVDGGVHWDSVAYPGPVRPVLDLQFKDFGHGIVEVRIPGSPYYSQILWTNDGATWEAQNLDDSPGITAIERLNDSTAVVAAHYQGVFVTKDWGKTWANMSVPGAVSLIQDFVSIGGDTVYFVGRNQIIQPYNTRFGRTFNLNNWAVIDMSVSQAMILEFVSPQKGWTTSGVGIFQTQDAGQTWQLQTPEPYGIFDVTFADSLHGWACGNGIYGTSDGGKTWVQQACPRTEESIRVLGVRSPGRAYVVSKDGLLEFSAVPDTASLCATSGLRPMPEATAYAISVHPNPTDGMLFIQLPDWRFGSEPSLQSHLIHLQVLNAQGQTVVSQQIWAENRRLELALPVGLASGLYYLLAQPTTGQRPLKAAAAARFVVER